MPFIAEVAETPAENPTPHPHGLRGLRKGFRNRELISQVILYCFCDQLP